MYSRYSGYQPFVPMNNRLSRDGEISQIIPGPEDESEQTPFPSPGDAPVQPHPIEQILPAAAAMAPAAQKGFLDSLFGGIGQNRSQRGGKGGSLGGLDLGGIAGLLRSGGGGIARLLQNFSIDWDSGDILMVLILLFMSIESDDDEILILLALILVMGF